MSSGRTAYRARWVIPVTSQPIENGVVCVAQDGLIEAVGSASEIDTSGARVVDLRESAIMPGLVNVHAHPELTVLRGTIEDLPFTDWISRLTEQKYEVLTPDVLRASTWLGVAEAIAAGVTCLAAPDDAGHLALAMKETGLRGRVYREVFGPAPDQASAALAELTGEVDAMRADVDGSRVEIGISPHAPFTVSADLFSDLSAYAMAEALPVCIHVAESAAEELYIRDGAGPFAERLRSLGIDVVAQGVSPVAWLAKTGILGARALLVHCVRVDRDDIARVADSGASVAHCPVSNARFAHGVAPLPAFIEAGIPVGLGSDSVASNNRVDILEEARFASLMQRALHHDPTLLSPSELLQLATLEGARALGLSEWVGSLEPGKQADLTAIRLDVTHSTPPGEPVTALFHSAQSSDVILTVVAGRELYREGEFRTLDWSALVKELGPA